MTEWELVQKAKSGDQEAFGELVVANEKKIYTLCRRLTGNASDAEDLAQEAFLNAWKGLGKFQGDSSFSTWLYRLASNVCIDFLRKEKRRQSVSMTLSLDDSDAERQADIPDETQSPHQLYERGETQAAIAAGLNRLSVEHRQILIMREINGLSYAEIAQVLGIGEGTVKSRISRARLSLRNSLQKMGTFL